MATRPQAPRQWFRLPSVVRAPAPPTAPAPEPPAPQPRLPMGRAPFRPMAMPQQTQPQESTPELAPANGFSSVPTSPIKTTSVPSSPAPTIVPATTSPPKPQVSAPPPPPSPPTSPPKPAPAVTITTRVPGNKSPPPQSPNNKPTAPPPSPWIPQPATAQLKSKPELEPMIPPETEQKTVLVQTTSEKPKSWLNGTGNHKAIEDTHKLSSYAHHGNHEVLKDAAKKERGHRQKFSSDSNEGSMRVITISGDNKGAVMEVIKSPSKSKHSFDGNSYTLHGTGWKSSSSSDEVKAKKDKNHKAKATHSPPMSVFMNSNVQGINNSIVSHSSCSHHDPGVHLSLSRNPSGNGFRVKDKSNGGGGHHSNTEQFAKEEN